MVTEQCPCGCIALSGGDVRHYVGCIHYRESIAAMYDRECERSARLLEALDDIVRFNFNAGAETQAAAAEAIAEYNQT